MDGWMDGRMDGWMDFVDFVVFVHYGVNICAR